MATNHRTGYAKKRIPDATRRAVALRYGCPPGGTKTVPCAYCPRPGAITWTRCRDGRPSFWVHFEHELDHVIPEFLGGPNTPENLVLACRPCNRRRGWWS